MYNTPVYASTFISIVAYSLLYFDQVIRNVNELEILKQFDFWLVSGYLIYFLSSFFIIIFYDEVPLRHRAFLWSLQNMVLFISASLTFSGYLWITYKNKSS